MTNAKARNTRKMSACGEYDKTYTGCRKTLGEYANLDVLTAKQAASAIDALYFSGQRGWSDGDDAACKCEGTKYTSTVYKPADLHITAAKIAKLAKKAKCEKYQNRFAAILDDLAYANVDTTAITSAQLAGICDAMLTSYHIGWQSAVSNHGPNCQAHCKCVDD